jgi:hypothetical protein
MIKTLLVACLKTQPLTGSLPRRWECVNIIISEREQSNSDSEKTDEESAIDYCKVLSAVWSFHQRRFEGVIDGVLHLASVPFVDLNNLQGRREKLIFVMMWPLLFFLFFSLLEPFL